MDVHPVVVLVIPNAQILYASLLLVLSVLVWVWKHMRIRHFALPHRKKT